jgi:hypothetical protein
MGVIFTELNQVDIVGKEGFLEFSSGVGFQTSDNFLEITEFKYPLAFGLVEFILGDVD